jgi:hypothetical protein
MERKIDPIIWFSAIGVVLLTVFLFVFIRLHVPKPGFGFKEATVAIDYGNGKVRVFKGPVEKNARAWDAFQQAIAAAGINAEITGNFVPQNIDGLKNGADGKYWNLYVNNTKQKFSPFEIQIKPGDEVVFRFE